MNGLARACRVALPIAVALAVLAARDVAAQLPVPGAPCSAHGTGVVRLQLVDPKGNVPTARANAVIVALRCGAVVDSKGIAELRGVPEGRYVVQVRVIGFPPESVAVAVSPGETVRATVHLHKAATTGTDARPRPAPEH